MRLPDICWTCACTTVDDMENEVVVYVDVAASTKDEAYMEAERRMEKRGLFLVSCNIMASPERKLPDNNVRALPAPVLPPPEVVAPVEMFPVAFFTKAATAVSYGNAKGADV